MTPKVGDPRIDKETVKNGDPGTLSPAGPIK